MSTHVTGQPAPIAPATAPEAAPGRSENSILAVARILVLIAGVGITAIGLSCGATGLLGILLSQAGGGVDALTAVQSVTAYTGFVTLSSALGLALAWHGWRAIQGHRSAPFQPPAVWPLILLFLLALAIGQLVLSLDLLPALTFPLAHVVVAIAPPLAIVGLVGRALRGTGRWRGVTLQLAAGAFLSTALAFTFELGILLVLLVAALTMVGLQPGGAQLLTGLADSLGRLQFQDPNVIFELLDLPLVAAGAILVIAVIVPLLEELIKTVGIGLMAYRRPGKAQAILWGVTAGAGFAIVEGLFNTITSLDAWSLVVVLRIGATLLHCFTGALMGLAWYHLLAGRWQRTLGLYAGSVAVHAAWNGLSVGMSVVSINTGGSGNVTSDVLLSGAASVAMLVLLITLAGGMAAGLAWLTRHADVPAAP